MNDSMTIKLNSSFKSDIEKSAEARGMSVSEYVREATRREMQHDLIGDNNE